MKAWKLDLRAEATVIAVALFAILTFHFPNKADAQTRTYQTEHYRLVTDVDPDLAADLSRRMDAMFEEYSTRLAGFARDDATKRFNVFVFTKRNDYMRFIDNRLPNTGGVFIPQKDALAAFLETQGRDALRRTLQHEAFHQFAFQHVSDDMPLWINEGIAQLFEEGIWTGRGFIVAQAPPRRIRQLRADMVAGKLTPFDDFIAIDHQTWARNMRDRERGATQYNQAWAMIHFLVYATDQQGRPAYRKEFNQLLRKINEGTDGQTAFKQVFGENFRGFQQRFVEWAQTLQPSREASYVERLEVLADLMMLLRERGVKFDSPVDMRKHLAAGRYQLQYTKGQLRWSSESDINVYFKDLDGRELSREQIRFDARGGTPLPDVVLAPSGPLEYRARFYVAADGKLEREIVVSGR